MIERKYIQGTVNLKAQKMPPKYFGQRLKRNKKGKWTCRW